MISIGAVLIPSKFSVNAGDLIGPTDWHEVNDAVTPIGYTSQIAKNFALSNCSNSGVDLLSVWYDGTDVIYKYSAPDVMAFRPAPIPEIALIRGTLPEDVLRLQSVADNSRYGIKDHRGKTIQMGTVGQSSTINIAGLSSGPYKLMILQPGGGVQSLDFSKL